MNFLVQYSEKRVNDEHLKSYSKLLYKYYVVLNANENPYSLLEKFSKEVVKDAIDENLKYLSTINES